ncbi:MAG: glycosyltransferase [Oscillospiraceae bacterium]|nr:glycosyltransferase [Oscillospiraceae bacterium]
MSTVPAVSIVMPIFNALPYLYESLDSVVNQSLREIEIICVNDGSTDESLRVMQEYAARDSRIKIIDKPNGGYGHTMNRGIAAATGEYIGILEPDDFADPDMFADLYRSAVKYRADVVKSNYYEYKTADGSNTFCEVLKGRPYDTLLCPAMEETSVILRPCIWTAIYKRSFLEERHIVFNETPGASYQDTSFAFRVLASAQRGVYIRKGYLHYRTDNENSSVKSGGKVFCICDEFQTIQAFLNTDALMKQRFIGPLQVLKLDSYSWNLERIAPEFKEKFRDQIALEFIKARYENLIERRFFDDKRWAQLQGLLAEYEAKESTALALKKKYGKLPPPSFGQRLKGGVRCVLDHGLLYTVKLFFKKLRRAA